MEPFFNYNSVKWIWVGLTILFALIEAFTLGLTTIWFALAALVMVFLSFLDIPLTWQILIFLVISAVLLIFTRPVAIKKLKAGREKTNVDTLVGRHALVTKDISEFDKGEIKIHGVPWSALSEDSSEIKTGSKCIIVRIEGVQAIVRPISDTENAADDNHDKRDKTPPVSK
jgi:membrane protein implicated in regulation of membrane protease activity